MTGSAVEAANGEAARSVSPLPALQSPALRLSARRRRPPRRGCVPSGHAVVALRGATAVPCRRRDGRPGAPGDPQRAGPRLRLGAAAAGRCARRPGRHRRQEDRPDLVRHRLRRREERLRLAGPRRRGRPGRRRRRGARRAASTPASATARYLNRASGHLVDAIDTSASDRRRRRQHDRPLHRRLRPRHVHGLADRRRWSQPRPPHARRGARSDRRRGQGRRRRRRCRRSAR